MEDYKRHRKLFYFLFLSFLFTVPIQANSKNNLDNDLLAYADSTLNIFLDNFTYSPSKTFDTLFTNYNKLKKIYLDKKRYNNYYLLNMVYTYYLLMKDDNLLAMSNNNELFLLASIRKDNIGLLDAYMGLGRIYANVGMRDECLNYSEISWNLAKKENMSDEMKLQVLIHLISMSLETEDASTTYEYIKEYKSLDLSNINEIQRGYVDLSFARYYYKIGKTNKADKLITSVKNLISKYPHCSLKSLLLYTQGTYNYDIKNYNKALQFFNEYLARPEVTRLHYLNALEKKGNIKYFLGNFQEAASILDSLIIIRNNAVERMYSSSLDQLSSKYQTYEVQREINLNKKNKLKFLLISILLLLIIVVIFILVMTKNTKEIKKKTQELDESRETAIKAIKNKVTILSNMSHEVRTPLNAIIGFSNILLSDETLDDDTMIECRNIIRNNAHMLQHLIAENSSELSIKYKNYDLVDICKSIIKTIITSYNPEVDIRFVKSEAIGDSLFILTDRYRLNQVIVNILTNSIKFTEQGFIELKLDIKDEKTLLFSVTDTGKGVSEEIKSKLYERYINKDNTGKGTGLGLSISYEIVNLMGGKLWLDESYKMGARFIFTLPFVQGVITNNK